MARINFTGGLKREIHHIKNAEDPDGGYEPSLVVRHDMKPGRSFIIPISAMWKYMDPSAYKKDHRALEADRQDFWGIVARNARVAKGLPAGGVIFMRPSIADMAEAARNLEACRFAYTVHKAADFMLCTAWNLAKLMQMFEITPSPQAAYQVLLWLQDRLEDLKNAPDKPESEKHFHSGEATIMVNGEKVGTREMTVSETELVLQSNG